MTDMRFPTLRKIELPVRKLKSGRPIASIYHPLMAKAGIEFRNWPSDLMNEIKLTQVATSVDLVKISVEELQLPDGTTTEAIYSRAREFDLHLCPGQVGPELRIVYLDQPEEEDLRIAMEQVFDFRGHRVFWLGRSGGQLWFGGNRAEPEDRWLGSAEWVFARRN